MTAMRETPRPFTLGEILDRTAQLYRRNFLLFAGVAAAPTGVFIAVFVAVAAVIAFFGVTAKGTLSPSLPTGILVLVVVLVGLPIGVAATVFSHAGLTRTAVSAHMGERLTIRGALKGVWPQFWRYLGVMVLQVIFAGVIPGVVAGVIVLAMGFAESLIGFGTSAAAAVGFLGFLFVLAVLVYIVWRAIGYSMGMAACVVEDKPAWESLHRSVKLSKGTRGRIFVMFLLVWALIMVLSMIAYVPIIMIVATVTAIGHGAEYAAITTILAEMLNLLINFALQTLITPVYVTALVLFYYDQRIRTEGYDIEWMMEQAGLTDAQRLSGGVQIGSTSEPPADPDTVKVS
jgi:uncharacterized membrane protein